MEDASLVAREETRVMGLGVGVFLIFFFSLVSVLICLIGATTPRPGAFICGGISLVSLVTLVLLTAQRESRFVEDKSDQLQEYDETFYPRVIILTIIALAALVGLGGLCVSHIAVPIHATPLYDTQKEPRRPLF
ncbi:unnamed protein product [Discosporangium mesarthrocarpum]